MECNEKYFSNHSIKQMFARNISKEEVDEVILKGEIITEYNDDKPYPSFLILGFVNKKPLHILTAKDETGKCIIITAYQPEPLLWTNNFKTKKI